jgi:hypothetical protein
MKAKTLKLESINDIENIRKTCMMCLNSFVKDKKQKIEVTISNAKSQRSIKQNSLIHGLFAQISVNSTHVGTGEYFSPKIWKEYLKDQFLTKNKTMVLGTEVIEMKSTSKLTRKECAEFTDSILRFCYENEIEIKITTDEYDFLTGKE